MLPRRPPAAGAAGGASVVVYAPGARITTGSATVAAGSAPLVTEAGSGNLIEASRQLLQKIGILKQQPNLDLQQQQAIRGVEQNIARLDARELAIKQKFKQACASHPALQRMKSEQQRLSALKQLFPADYTEWTSIKASRKNNVKIIETIMMQKTKIEGHRSRTAALGVLQAGNTALGEEMKKARDAFDVSTIADDTTDLFQESLADDREFFEDIDGIQTGGDTLGDLSIQTLDGESLTIDDALASELGEMRAEMKLEQDEDALSLRGELGSVPVPRSPAPTPSRQTARTATPAREAVAFFDEGEEEIIPRGPLPPQPSRGSGAPPRSSPSLFAPVAAPRATPPPAARPKQSDMRFEDDFFA
jgi:hypothetical protein